MQWYYSYILRELFSWTEAKQIILTAASNMMTVYNVIEVTLNVYYAKLYLNHILLR